MASGEILYPIDATKVVFKHEDSADDGVPIGPVWFVTETGAFLPAVPGDLDFMGAPSARWMTVTDAHKLARHFDLPFEEV